MKDSVREYFILLREKKKHAQRLFALLLCLSILVSSNTSWQLHLVGIGYTGTPDKDGNYCGQEEHVHTAECDDPTVLSCGIAEGAIMRHKHTEKCKGEEPKLICNVQEHTHTDKDGDCYEDGKVLKCKADHHLDECYKTEKGNVCPYADTDHQHTEECYTTHTLYSCGLTEHIHTDECYTQTRVLNCDITDVSHTHTDTCYKDEQILKCTETQHTHADDCTRVEQFLSCQKHVHSDACIGDVKVLDCDNPEHDHKDECYEPARVLCCEIEEHEHDYNCYELVCGKTEEDEEPHRHDEECYICKREEHKHDIGCKSNPEADVETKEQYLSLIPEYNNLEWYQNILDVAIPQIGYTESAKNYYYNKDTNKTYGYTRYGQWYTDLINSYIDEELEGAEPADYRYSEWGALFAYFCYYYAGFNDEPMPENYISKAYPIQFDPDPAKWAQLLEQTGAFQRTEDMEYEPMPGSLAFMDMYGDDGVIDTVAIVADYLADEETGAITIDLIWGAYQDMYDTPHVEILEGEYFIQYPDDMDAYIEAMYGISAAGVGDMLFGDDDYEDDDLYAAYATANTANAATADIGADDLTNLPDILTGETSALNQMAANDTSTSNDGVDDGGTVGGSTGSTGADLTSDRIWNPSQANIDQFVGFGFSQVLYQQMASLNAPTPAVTLDPTASVYVIGPNSKVTVTNNNLNNLANSQYNYPKGYILYRDETSTNYSLGNVVSSTGSKTVLNSIERDKSTFEDDQVWFLESAGTNQYYLKNLENGLYLVVSNYTDLSFDPTSSPTAFTAEASGGGLKLYVESGSTKYYLARSSSNNHFTISSDNTGNVFTVAEPIVYKPVQTISPSSTVINLFDYRVMHNSSENNSQGWEMDNWKEDNSYGGNGAYPHGGINNGHPFKFSAGDVNKQFGPGNYFTGFMNDNNAPKKGQPYQGIVNRLLVNGYPELSTGGAIANVNNGNKSLQYLFDGSQITDNQNYVVKQAWMNVGGLLQQDDKGYYYFTSSKAGGSGSSASQYKATYAVFNYKTNQFIVYDDWALYHENAYQGGSPKFYGQFFPFDRLSDWVNQYENDDHNIQQTTSTYKINHYLGLDLTSRFIQRYGGKSFFDSNEDMIFEFSGDDDIWVFVDDVLVADLGGLHIRLDFKINFATGEVTYTRMKDGGGVDNLTQYNTTIYDMFHEAGKTGSVTWQTATQAATVQDTKDSNHSSHPGKNLIFADNTAHTLKFFYLERGGDASNMFLKYNLTEIPRTGMSKVDQYNNAIAGAGFAFYPAIYDANALKYNYKKSNGTDSGISVDTTPVTVNADHSITVSGQTIPAKYYAVTDTNGEMQFSDASGAPLTMKKTHDLLGDFFVMKEIQPPSGYRSVSDYTLLQMDNQFMKVLNPYVSGVWTNPNIMTESTNKLYVTEYDPHKTTASSMGLNSVTITGSYTAYEIPYNNLSTGTQNGTLFAVVLQRNGHDKIASTTYPNGDVAIDRWDAVWGSNAKGYTTVTNTDTNSNMAAVIAAAQAQQANIGGSKFPVFTKSSLGTMEIEVDDLPGDPAKYYTALLEQSHKTGGTPQNDADYYVAFYWTSANSLSGATTSNTVRVRSHDSEFPTGQSQFKGFNNTYGATIEVPNVINTLYITKVDEAGMAMNGAQFALYPVTPYGSNGEFYYSATLNNKNYVLKDDGTAAEYNGGGTTPSSYPYNYTIDGSQSVISGDNHGHLPFTAGEITITNGSGGVVNKIKALSADETHNAIEPSTSPDPATQNNGGVAMQGIAHFEKIPNGTYVVREIKAPPGGYKLNTDQIKVIVNGSGVYANAGTATDDVAVGATPGNLVTSMNNMASADIDQTLTWIDFFIKRNSSTAFAVPSTWEIVTQKSTDTPGHGTASETISSSVYQKAMINYMIYDPKNSEFDYRPEEDADVAKAGGSGQQARDHYYAQGSSQSLNTGQGTNRLYTDAGWVSYDVFQDHSTLVQTYLRDQNKAYTALGGQNIRALFTGGTIIEVTNHKETPPDVTMKVKKVGNGAGTTDIPLDNAKFKLYRWIQDTATQKMVKKYYTLVTETSGTTTVEKVVWDTDKSKAKEFTTATDPNDPTLPPAFFEIEHLDYDIEYYLEETAAPPKMEYPAGSGTYITFKKIDKDVKFTLEKTSTTYPKIITDTSVTPSNIAEVKYIKGGNTGEQIIEVKDKVEYDLPHTGGSGTAAYTAVGLTLTAAAVILLMKKRKEEKVK